MLAITDADFNAQVLQSNVPVLVDFFATWCGPCQAQAPILEDLSKKIGEKAKIVKVDVDENHITAQTYGIMSIPTLKLFKDGKDQKTFMGLTRADILEAAINELL